jgi:hypothetical protein
MNSLCLRAPSCLCVWKFIAINFIELCVLLRKPTNCPYYDPLMIVMKRNVYVTLETFGRNLIRPFTFIVDP